MDGDLFIIYNIRWGSNDDLFEDELFENFFRKIGIEIRVIDVQKHGYLADVVFSCSHETAHSLRLMAYGLGIEELISKELWWIFYFELAKKLRTIFLLKIIKKNQIIKCNA